MFTNPLIRRAERASAEVEAGLDPSELRWFFHLRMAGGTVALAAFLLAASIWAAAPYRAAATGIGLPSTSRRDFSSLQATTGWPNFSVPWGVPAAIALAGVVLTVLTFCVGERLRRGMWMPLVTCLVLTAVFLGVTTGLYYWGSPRWQHWQVVFALVPLVAAAVVQVTHMVDVRRTAAAARARS